MPKALPLKNFRIVSLALNLPGPAALMRCRVMGATCIKFEPPASAGGDPMRIYSSVAYAQLHQGIRVKFAHLKTDKGQAALAAELAKADLLLTSFRPSALKRLGLDWHALHKRYPQLSQVAIVGGEGDAAEVAGHDLTYLAEFGLVTGLDLPATLFADMAGSLLTVEAILGLAIKAKMAGKPDHVRVTLSNAAQYLALPRTWGLTKIDGSVGGAHMGYQVYKCLEGRAAVAALEPHFATRLCSVAGILKNGELSTRELMLSSATKAKLKRWFSEKTCGELDDIAKQQDLPIYVMPQRLT